jgi:MFS family permease
MSYYSSLSGTYELQYLESRAMIRKIQENIYKLYLIKLSKWLMLIMPIVALFYRENGLSDFDIYLLQAIYAVSVALLEIPSGYMADIIGRKKSLVLGSIMGSVGFFIYAFSSSFSGFLAAEIILGAGGSFISGSDSALLFDSLAAINMKHRYLQYEGRITSLGNFAETAAALCGGLLAGYLGYRSVYFTQGIIAFIAVPASLLLVEPPREHLIKTPGISHIIKVCKETLVTDRKLQSAIFFSSLIGVATLCMAWTAQIYFVANGLTTREITPLWITLNLTVALVAAYAAHIVIFLGEKKSLFIILIFIPMGYIMLGVLQFHAAVLSLFIFYAVRGYATPVLKDLINNNCSSATRATVLSIRSMIIRFGFASIGPVTGYFSEQFSLTTALVITGFILMSLSAVSGYMLLTKTLTSCN